MTMSNRLAVMNEGEVQQFARPLECYNQPANEFVAGFIGSPSMNFFDAEVTADGVRTPAFDVAFDPTRYDLDLGREVTLGIRPEDLALSDSDGTLADPTEPFGATVDVVEPVGDEVFIYFRIGGVDDREDQLLMSAPPDPELTGDIEGTSHRVRLDRSRIHLFDARTGDAILHGIEEPPSGQREARGTEPS